jgi:predicted RNA binding protein YcfA (HicA-like mRNA interferase family)
MIMIVPTPRMPSENRTLSVALYVSVPLNVSVRVLTRFLNEHGWEYKNTEGDHHHFVNGSRPGKVTIVGPENHSVFGGLLASILRQAGLNTKELRKWLNR